ncbi:MAG: ATP synthase F1 subunit delta [Actinobacteria bacterium]|nr:ATP synthase F1 subunit delta [Actinomycetota bacterium]
MADRAAGYAAAIFELARAEGELERVETELPTVARAISATPDLRSTLTDPQVPAERKQGVIDDLIGGRASHLTVGLVQLVVGLGRVAELPDIARSLLETAAASRERALAEVRSAVPLDEATIERLTKALGEATGRRVEVKVLVDPSVIGGVVARIGDTVIDGSISRKVEELRQAVKSR